MQTLAEARQSADRSNERWWTAELARLHADILQHLGPTNTAAAEQAYRDAIDIATGQQAHSLLLRAAIGLARLYRDSGNAQAARDALLDALAVPLDSAPEL